MAFQTGVSTSIDNLMQTLSTFLQANGWTEDDITTGATGRMSIHKNSIYVHFQWTDTVDGGTLAMYQSLGYINSGTSKWLHTDDSGSGQATASSSSLDNGRCVNKFEGPHTNYWFFEKDSSPAYINVVVEVDAGRFRHFGFGELDKIGDWTGGEYCYGHLWGQTATQIDNPASTGHAVGFGAGDVSTDNPCTLHIEGHTGEPNVNTKWAAIGGSATSGGTDRSVVARWPGLGGSRGGPWVSPFAHMPISQLNAFKPLMPISVMVRDTAPTPDAFYLLGFQKDVAVINIKNIDPASTVVVGSDTWYIFPWVRKQRLQVDTEESWNAGWAYKQDLT